MLRAAAVERSNDRLRLDGHFMLRAVAEVNQLFGMSHRKTGASACVSGVGGTGRKSAAQRSSHIGVVDGTGPASVSGSLIIAVPAGSRHPNLDLDVGIARRFQRRRH